MWSERELDILRNVLALGVMYISTKKSDQKNKRKQNRNTRHSASKFTQLNCGDDLQLQIILALHVQFMSKPLNEFKY